ncbi:MULTISPECIES: hypothetical protein [Streptomyces]|uniref:hypothetical protein n=1 Tax=Streptomyces TaxID=1883 RepID=UPI000AD6271B|nr:MULTISPECIES: hypothetical protein [Streptomyces]
MTRPWRKLDLSAWVSPAATGRWSCTRCGAEACSYRYRIHPPASPRYERCVGLTWCTHCRVYSAALVHVPHTTHLDDESMPPARPGQDERPGATEVQVLDHVDRLLPGP